jgi:hypothetical protein
MNMSGDLSMNIWGLLATATMFAGVSYVTISDCCAGLATMAAPTSNGAIANATPSIEILIRTRITLAPMAVVRNYLSFTTSPLDFTTHRPGR